MASGYTIILTLVFLTICLLLLYLLLEKSKKEQTLNKELEKFAFRLRLSEESRYGLEKYRLAVENVSDLFIITDRDGAVVEVNNSVEQITGFTREEVLGKNTSKLWGGHMEKSYYENMWHVLKVKKEIFTSELVNHKKSGQPFTAEIRVSPILGKNKEIIFFVAVERDITRAKEIDRMKTEFISLASHQLRTPLSAMKWYLEMLLDGDMGDMSDEQQEAVTNINESNERMIELVNALLNVSRIESGRIMIDPKPTDIGKLAQSVVTELQMKFSEKKQDMVVSIHENLPQVNIDSNLVRHVYTNLLTNASKYSPEHGEIHLFISKDNDQIITQISDNGYGIPKEEHERVFQKFFRAENVIKIETEGTGLGLYLAKAVVESSGGKIWFESDADKGTTFWFSLPLSGSAYKKGEVTLNG